MDLGFELNHVNHHIIFVFCIFVILFSSFYYYSLPICFSFYFENENKMYQSIIILSIIILYFLRYFTL